MKQKNKFKEIQVKLAIYTEIMSFLIYVPLYLSSFSLNWQSIGRGVFISACNFYVILWAWSRIFFKKKFAFALSLIVIKYLLVIFIIYKVISNPNTNEISFILGLFMNIILITAVALAWFGVSKKEKITHGSF